MTYSVGTGPWSASFSLERSPGLTEIRHVRTVVVFLARGQQRGLECCWCHFDRQAKSRTVPITVISSFLAGLKNNTNAYFYNTQLIYPDLPTRPVKPPTPPPPPIHTPPPSI